MRFEACCPPQVREKDLPVVIHTLAGEFDIYKEVNGESIPVNCDDASNGFLKPKHGESRTRLPGSHPVCPLQSGGGFERRTPLSPATETAYCALTPPA